MMDEEMPNSERDPIKGAGATMPALFVGHGSPTNAVEDNEFSRAWTAMGMILPRPEAILCISAHWETLGTWVTAMDRPRTIHDFQGFPQALFDMQYPAPGSAVLARRVQETVKSADVQFDLNWGLDHGTWSVLSRFYPEADIPVVQLSLDRTREPRFHYELGKELRSLRNEGILILGSGNIVHNLRAMVWEDRAYGWALEFDETVQRLIVAGDHAAIIDYPNLGPAARLSVPTNEHYLPLLCVLGAQGAGGPIQFFADRVTLGSMSMRSIRIG
jgi:4,5-DOPA dioxygenase extradiol